MTVPGVNVQTAATFMAAIGDIRRFPSPRKLVSYLGLDPRVRQSGSTPARHGRTSKAGASEPRHMLGEVAWKDRKSTRLNSSHSQISYAVFCLKKKKKKTNKNTN